MRQKAKFGQLSNVSELSDQLINVAELIGIIMLLEYGQHKTIFNVFKIDVSLLTDAVGGWPSLSSTLFSLTCFQ